MRYFRTGQHTIDVRAEGSETRDIILEEIARVAYTFAPVSTKSSNYDLNKDFADLNMSDYHTGQSFIMNDVYGRLCMIQASHKGPGEDLALNSSIFENVWKCPIVDLLERVKKDLEHRLGKTKIGII